MADVKRLRPGPRLSGAVVHGNLVYLAGQVADGPDVKSQTQAVLARIDELLKAAGTDKSKLLAATVYLADIRGYDDMNGVWDAWVDKTNAPARATVEARLAATKYLVEIAGVAAI